MPVQALREVGERLLEVHGQLEFQLLGQRSYQRELLDSSGGLQEELQVMREAYRAWRRLEQDRAAFDVSGREREHRLGLLEHYVAELEALDPKPDEAAQLAEERRRIGALGRLSEGTTQVAALLAGDDGDVTAALGRAQAVLRQLTTLDAALEEPAGLIEEASIACREAVASLRRYADSLEADPARQDWLESRLAALEDAARKHRVETRELPGLRKQLASELQDPRIERDRVAERLRAARRDAAAQLDARVTALMQGLGMPAGVFTTRIAARDDGQCSEHGADEIEFLVSANPGQPPRPLARVASGGELSRISLALQVATLDTARLPCLVFDEVDAGVGGAVAEVVGRQLKQLAGSGQVLCVTHLAQVAAQADHQLSVSKQVAGGAMRTSVRSLDAETRVEEVARMLGGTRITATTREHAREMLESGRRQARAVRASANGKGNPRGGSGRAGSASGRRD